jgi:hypothetical protein
MRIHPLIVVYNHPESGLKDADVQATLDAHKHCLDYHFEPQWNVTANFVLGNLATPIPRTANIWEHHLLGTSDQAGALGYHLDDNGVPVMRTFVQTDIKYNLSWRVTFSHEVTEALVDKSCLLASQDPNANSFFGFEVGDPVEGDQYAYMYNNVEFTDFAVPAWFTGDPGPYDYKHHCSKPYEILPDGYVSKYEKGSWTSYQQQHGQLVRTHAEVDVDQPRIRDRNARMMHNEVVKHRD